MTKDTKNKQLIFLHLFEENIWRLFTRNKYDYLWDSATQNIQRKQTAEMHIGTAETWICIQYHWQKRTWFGPVVTQVSICRSLFIHFCTKSDFLKIDSFFFFFFPNILRSPLTYRKTVTNWNLPTRKLKWPIKYTHIFVYQFKLPSFRSLSYISESESN